MQWKLPKTFSNWIQRAGRAARGHGQIGTAILLVERSAYSINISERDSTLAMKLKSKGKGSKKPTKPKERKNKNYAEARGVLRGSSKKIDSFPSSDVAIIDPASELNDNAEDEGLLAFVQAISCRRQVWASAFESPLNISQSVSNEGSYNSSAVFIYT